MTATQASASGSPGSTKPVPPGALGLPILGDTLALLKDPSAFLERKHRELGPIFKFRLLGETVVAMAGPEAIARFLDEDTVTREGASPPHLQAILNPTAVPFIDGERHKKKKRLLLQAFTPEALDAYLPTIERVMARYVKRWETQRTLAWVPELQAMCFAIGDAIFTGADPNKENLPIQGAFDAMAAAALAVPVNLPFTTFGRGLKGRDELRVYMAKAIELHRKEKRDDALSRLLDAREPDGSKLSDEDIVVELIHFFFAAYTGVYSAMSYEALHVAQHPDVMKKLREEIATAGDGPLTMKSVATLGYLDQVTKEVRRYQRLLPLTFFGRVKTPFELHGFAVPAGWKAVGSIGVTLHDPVAFKEPATFDPDRFSPARAEDVKCPHAYVPHGPGTLQQHRCGGEALATLLMKAFLVHTLRAHDWTIEPGQRLDVRLGSLFPAPVGGLQVSFVKR